MDIARPDVARSRRRRRILITIATTAALVTVTVGLSRLKPAAPSVERGVQLIDTVKRSQLLTQQAAAAQVEAEYHQAKLQAEADTELGKSGLVSALNVKLSNVRADELANRTEIEKKRLEISEESNRAQLLAQDARVEQL